MVICFAGRVCSWSGDHKFEFPSVGINSHL